MYPYLATTAVECLLLDCHIWLYFVVPVFQTEPQSYAIGHAPESEGLGSRPRDGVPRPPLGTPSRRPVQLCTRRRPTSGRCTALTAISRCGRAWPSAARLAAVDRSSGTTRRTVRARSGAPGRCAARRRSGARRRACRQAGLTQRVAHRIVPVGAGRAIDTAQLAERHSAATKQPLAQPIDRLFIVRLP